LLVFCFKEFLKSCNDVTGFFLFSAHDSPFRSQLPARSMHYGCFVREYDQRLIEGGFAIDCCSTAIISPAVSGF